MYHGWILVEFRRRENKVLTTETMQLLNERADTATPSFSTKVGMGPVVLWFSRVVRRFEVKALTQLLMHLRVVGEKVQLSE